MFLVIHYQSECNTTDTAHHMRKHSENADVDKNFQTPRIFLFFYKCSSFSFSVHPNSLSRCSTFAVSQSVFLDNDYYGGRNSSLVVFGLAVHSVAGSIFLWGNFPVEGIFPLELTWVQTPFPKKLFRMRV